MTQRPFLLLAELTYRCPLHCPYCSNPASRRGGLELSAAEWRRVFEEAAQIGVLHVGLSGGEPLLRPDLAELAAAARTAGLYSNLITSGLGFTPARAAELKAAGLDSVQISFQADEPGLGDQIAGAAAHLRKRTAAAVAHDAGFPLSLNVVLHAGNIDRTAAIIALAEEMKAGRLELANAQFYGWAFANRRALLPSAAQLAAAGSVAAAAKARLRGSMDILFVASDYYLERPKPCMNGWGRRYMTVNPVGEALPCPSAFSIAGLRFDNVRERSLDWIWRYSGAFNRFRGTDWMREPCLSCDFREVDFGGCRCQAFLLTGDASVADPACSLSPSRDVVSRIVNAAQEPGGDGSPSCWGEFEIAYRSNPADA